MTNREKLFGGSSEGIAMEFWSAFTFTYCHRCPIYRHGGTCRILDTDEEGNKCDCVKELAHWLDSEMDKDFIEETYIKDLYRGKYDGEGTDE